MTVVQRSFSIPRRLNSWTKSTSKARPTKYRARRRKQPAKMTGNEKLEAEGKFDKAKGEVRQGVGDVKDAIEEG
jgi:hypothetical protein